MRPRRRPHGAAGAIRLRPARPARRPPAARGSSARAGESTTTTRPAPAASAARTGHSPIGCPHSSCSTFGVAERMRVPWPAARITTVGEALMARLYRREGWGQDSILTSGERAARSATQRLEAGKQGFNPHLQGQGDAQRPPGGSSWQAGIHSPLRGSGGAQRRPGGLRLGGRDSNPDSQDQNLMSCRWTTPQRGTN